MRFNYMMNIYTKWYRSYFYFCAKYACPDLQAISTSFETKFARMEYAGNRLFNISYMRHTETWFEIFRDLSIDECLETIQNFITSCHKNIIKEIHIHAIGFIRFMEIVE
ncbi:MULTISPECIES: hypothetical protein [Methanosarcina]|uniref:DUF3024 domain-containing protein n=1 Tax=Methanosarcina TaxID=2207 RepID=UPI000B17DA78|nr:MULTISPECIES: hypothetical protein [Methanosarcina]